MQQITFGQNLPGYEIGNKTSPAVIVLHEWWGADHTVKELATLISKEGFRCLVPDLYKGKTASSVEDANKLMNELGFTEAVAEVKQAADYLRSTGSPAVGCTGFSMGGALVFAALAEGANIDAGAPFYGIPDGSNDRKFDLSKIKVPLLVQFGEKDSNKGFSSPETAKDAVDTIKAGGGNIELIVYKSGGHDFLNALTESGMARLKECGYPIPEDADLHAAKDRLVTFLHKHLTK